MLDIQEMIKQNNFTPLINSTQEQRNQSGGNFYLYTQLSDNADIKTIQKIVRYVFKDDPQVLLDMYRYHYVEYQSFSKRS